MGAMDKTDAMASASLLVCTGREGREGKEEGARSDGREDRSQADARRSEGNTGYTTPSSAHFLSINTLPLPLLLPPPSSYLGCWWSCLERRSASSSWISLSLISQHPRGGMYLHDRHSLILSPCWLIDGLVVVHPSLPPSFFSALQTIRPRRCLTTSQSRKGC